jgi:hypothetical protein
MASIFLYTVHYQTHTVHSRRIRNIRNAQKILFGHPGGRDYFEVPGTDFTIVSRHFKEQEVRA